MRKFTENGEATWQLFFLLSFYIDASLGDCNKFCRYVTRRHDSKSSKAPLEETPLILRTQHDAQLDYYGRRLATCSSDRSVKIFDVTDGSQTLVADLRG